MSSVFYLSSKTLKFFKVLCEGVTPSRSRAVWNEKIILFAYNSEEMLYEHDGYSFGEELTRTLSEKFNAHCDRACLNYTDGTTRRKAKLSPRASCARA